MSWDRTRLVNLRGKQSTAVHAEVLDLLWSSDGRLFAGVQEHRARNIYLFLVSLFFYYKTSGFYFFILLFSTVVDYFIGRSIYANKVKWQRQTLVALSVVVNLLVLGYFKYAYFVADFIYDLTGIEIAVQNTFALWTNQALGTNFIFEKILLPVGISFFTFHDQL